MNKNLIKAWRLIQKVDGVGKTRKYCTDNGLISSLNTKNNYKYNINAYLDWRDFNGLPGNEQDKVQDLQCFLFEIAEFRAQKTVDSYKSALGKVFRKKLRNVKSQIPTTTYSRNYYISEILIIIKNMGAKNALSILMCFCAGLRAHELATLQRYDEAFKTDTRKWSDDRFKGIDRFQIYLVTGKGGLVREVAIPNELALLLEKRRRDTPVRVVDRGIYYNSNYDLGFGKTLSQAFSRASFKELGWSTGLHGTRHSYAQNRIFKLTNMRIEYEHAMKIVSEELGHFRPSITLCYLR